MHTVYRYVATCAHHDLDGIAGKSGDLFDERDAPVGTVPVNVIACYAQAYVREDTIDPWCRAKDYVGSAMQCLSTNW